MLRSRLPFGRVVQGGGEGVAAAAAFKRTGNNQSAAARVLGITHNKLARLLRG